ncbi:tyrosine-type recombinase/integrase [Pseudomonas umsongensis]|uniref:Site-specific integrase n=1 Tax=Pseudomonas umsongensis TaxID=198618 RepID=A0AAE6ZZM0_9PSED|nr:site-specific integrase [Pseudomonas umsongensis]QJC82382.1 site-specific integrase [Pseudomonas umsongensis]
MTSDSLPSLRIPNVVYGKFGTPWDLTSLLHRGASAYHIDKIDSLIRQGKFSAPILGRLPLVEKIHDEICARLAGGGSRSTAKSQIGGIRRFYAWADEQNVDLTFQNTEKLFIDWTEALLFANRIQGGASLTTIFSLVTRVSPILEEALNLNTKLIHKTRIKKPKRKTNFTKSEKQNLSDAFSMGALLLDISEALTQEKVRERLPIVIELRCGKTLHEWCRMMPNEKLKPHNSDSRKNRRNNSLINTSWSHRYPILNLRLEAELLIFIAQTGMNLAQAHQLRVGRFSYQSDGKGYIVRRIYKHRAQGEVEFQIYSEYRSHFEKYLEWRKEIYGDDPDGLLFPISSPKGRPENVAPTFQSIKKRCREIGIRAVGARELRKTRANWLLRQSKNVSLVAELNQHSEATLLRDYIRPNHQTALIEISRFIAKIDPAIAPPGPGACMGDKPAPVQDSAITAPTPDCSNPSGCLFCVHQRDVNSFDHMWSLASYRYCKSLELSTHRSTSVATHPSAIVIQEITKRLEAYQATSEETRNWIAEAQMRVEEEDYHPHWDIFIKLMER